MISLDKITKEGKALFLAYDQGLEHGPTDFTDENADPAQIIKIALYGEYTGVIVHKGIAEKYFVKAPFGEELARKTPIIIKLNGKTNLVTTGDPYSPLLCTVDEALALGAVAVGYTVYVGSEFENKMTQEFAEVVRDAHAKNIPVIGWMYPRGKSVEGKDHKEISAYAARIGLELGADIVKMQYPGDLESLKKVVEMAGKTKVVVSGGAKEEEEVFLDTAKIIMQSGAIGMAVGRNIWQSPDPMALTKKLQEIVFG